MLTELLRPVHICRMPERKYMLSGYKILILTSHRFLAFE